jgi:hypothetical protein
VSGPRRFRRRWQPVTAVRWNGLNAAEIRELGVDGSYPLPVIGDWVLRYESGTFGVMSHDEFEAAYEPAFTDNL